MTSNPDATLLASSSEDKTIRIVDEVRRHAWRCTALYSTVLLISLCSSCSFLTIVH